MAIQRTGHEPAVIVDMGNAANDGIGVLIFPATHPIPVISVEEAIEVDAIIPIQHLPATGGFVTEPNEMTFAHNVSLFYSGQPTMFPKTLKRHPLHVKSDASPNHVLPGLHFFTQNRTTAW